MKFNLVAHAFHEIEQTSSRLAMTQILVDLFKKASEKDIDTIINLSLGQLHPIYVGTHFGLADKMVTASVAKFLQKEVQAITYDAKQYTDIGQLISQYSWQLLQELTLHEVYIRLCELEQEGGSGSQERKSDLLIALLQDLDPLSAKYVVRIVIGKLRLGFSDMTIVDALSLMLVGDKSIRDKIEDAYNKCADLGMLASKLKQDGVAALDSISIVVGIPILPAAAERLPSAKAIIQKIGNCVAQPKLDGFRLQIHINKTVDPACVYFYSRNLLPMSDIFPELRGAVLDLNCEQLIAEGEAIGFDPNTGGFLPFQETVKRRRKHGVEQAASSYPLKLFLFDILYLNGTNVMAQSHEARRVLLSQLIKGVEQDTVQVIQEKKITSDKELEAYFLENIEQGLEGLVVKRPDAGYQPGKRNFNWIKLKRQEEGHLEDTIDCVVLGYYAGKGKRSLFGIGAFLVGIYNKDLDIFQTIAKIGTGMTDQEWCNLKKMCDERAVDCKPSSIECAKELTPDVWVIPEIVCQIRADEITKSPLHSAAKTVDSNGYALRFPRFMGYREDKSAYEATTAYEIVRLFEDQKSN